MMIIITIIIVIVVSRLVSSRRHDIVSRRHDIVSQPQFVLRSSQNDLLHRAATDQSNHLHVSVSTQHFTCSVYR